MRVANAREQYLRWLLATRDLSHHTIRAYDGDLAAFERHLGPQAGLGAIDGSRLISFIEVQRQSGLSPSSIRRRACGVRGFCRWLSSTGLLESDPWTTASVPRVRSRRLPRTLPSHELDRLLRSLRAGAGLSDPEAADTQLDRPHQATTLLGVALMVATGVRVHEVVTIACHDIDLAGRTLRLMGKGRRERQVFLTNDWISNLTSAYMNTREQLRVQHPYLLFNRHHAPLTPAAMRLRLANAARQAGLRSRVTPHMLRHTAATQLIESSVDIRYIQRLLGHASLATTEIYTHVSDNALKRVVSDADVLGRLTTGDN